MKEYLVLVAFQSRITGGLSCPVRGSSSNLNDGAINSILESEKQDCGYCRKQGIQDLHEFERKASSKHTVGSVGRKQTVSTCTH
jgi:hypothetical protein